MKKILFIIFLIFLLRIQSIFAISVYPEQIDFKIYGEEIECKNITIISSGSILINDRWAKKNLETKEMYLHKFSKDSLGIYLDYSKEIFVYEKEKVEVCFSGNSPGFYHGVLLIREETSNEGIGVWINATVLGNSSKVQKSFLTGLSVLGESSKIEAKSLFILSSLFLLVLFFFLLILLKKRTISLKQKSLDQQPDFL